MNRLVLVAAAFVAGLGGTTAVFAVRAKPAPPPAAHAVPGADSAKADSSARHATADSSAAAQTAAPAGASAAVAPPSAPADSARAAPAVATSAAGHATAPPAIPATGRAATTAVPAVPAAAPTATATPTAAPARTAPGTPARAASDSALRDVTYRQLARIYSAMTPTAAAEVLSHIGEEDVVGILTKLGTRQAAQVLGAMPRERAAGLSQRLLNASGAPRATP